MNGPETETGETTHERIVRVDLRVGGELDSCPDGLLPSVIKTDVEKFMPGSEAVSARLVQTEGEQ